MGDDYDAEEGTAQAAELVELVLEASGADAGRVLGVGMGLPGPIHRSGVVGSSAILPGWAGTHAAELMGERLTMAVWLGNDANLGALAEATWGAGRMRAARLPEARHGHRRRNRDRRATVRGGRRHGRRDRHTSLDETGDICRCGAAASRPTPAGRRSPGCSAAASGTRSPSTTCWNAPSAAIPAAGEPRRRRPRHRRGCRRSLQPHQPRADRRRGRHGRRRRRAARSAQKQLDCGRFRARPRTCRSSRRARERRAARRSGARAPRGRSRLERAGAGSQTTTATR